MVLRALVLSTLLAAIAAGQGPAPGAVNVAIDRGVSHLLRSQHLDGTWDYGQEPRAGHTALIAYTLVKSGLSREHHAVQRVMAHLQGARSELTYDTALLILALAAHDRERHGRQIQELVDQLLEWQKPTGWGYPSGSDLSNTQYASLGLWAGARAGADIPDRAWYDLIAAAGQYRADRGGFGYSPGGGAATGSMTAAGVGVLAICRDMLALKPSGKDRRRYQKVQGWIDEGLEWLDRNWSVTQNPGRGRSHLGYYLYGLERVGALAPTETIGDHDWYAEGASFLVQQQSPQGHWGSSLGGGHPQTCFALLFLRRATMPVSGGLHLTGGRRYSTPNDAPGVRIAASGDNPMGVWLTGFGADLQGELAWPNGGGVRVARVLWIVDGVEVAAIEGDEARPAGQERYEHQVRFDEPGAHTVRAQVQVLRPPVTDSAGRRYPATLKVLDSAPLTVQVEDACPDWMLDNARDRSRNLVPLAGATARASSSRGGSGAARAIDQHQARSWIAEATDPTPTLELTFAEPQEANVILVGHARSTPLDPGRWARALEVDVYVNGKRHRLRMHSDERRKGRLELRRSVEVRDLKLVVPFAAPGRGGEASVGFAEVELQLQR